MRIEAVVEGDTEVIRRFRAHGPLVRAELVKAVGRITLKLMRKVVQEKLTGQVLKRQTGTLARAVTQSPRTYEAGNLVIGTVGVDDITGKGGRAPVKYGRVHEYGFQGQITVKQHMRMVKEAFGRSITQRAVVVPSHTRHMNLPARSFLRTALRELKQQGVIDAELTAAIAEANRK
jgi:hypothetical protein